MKLFLLAQEIKELEVGLVNNGELIESVLIKRAPEQYLEALATQLNKWHTSLDALEGVFVVTSPGSFTASRVSLVIANTISFSKQIPVYAIDNPNRLSISALHQTLDYSKLAPSDFALPHYDRPPMIR
jgi:tRNA A37 threonylcarbamoyladenosine modification protein TsaB